MRSNLILIQGVVSHDLQSQSRNKAGRDRLVSIHNHTRQSLRSSVLQFSFCRESESVDFVGYLGRSMTKHAFGGSWTADKLSRLKKYLAAYATILQGRGYRFAYFDAFAGTGYVNKKRAESDEAFLFPELAAEEAQEFIKGSARIALESRPVFDRYFFIDTNPKHAEALSSLRADHPELASKIEIVNTDANEYLARLCKRDWKKSRAVVFLDPYGMNVKWETIKAIAKTQAIDLWLLFPLGVAVNRILKRDGKIDAALRKRLDDLFGETKWFEEFYKPATEVGLFAQNEKIVKTANFDSIEAYFQTRLKSIFAKVAKNPLRLMNSKNVPLFLLCFAAGNPKGAPTAVKIAEHILGAKS